jgi:hypothetical protein
VQINIGQHVLLGFLLLNNPARLGELPSLRCDTGRRLHCERPGGKMRAFVGSALWSAIAGLFLISSAYGQAGFDRPGGDYANSIVRSGDPAACAARCERDSHCRAWTFSYPATAGANAICWLKAEVTPRVRNACCISGVRGAGVPEPRRGVLEFGIDRFGGDYRNFEMPSDPNGGACKAACEGDGRCRAWTYVRPGYHGPSARCYLKDRLRAPRRKPCCISGVVR